jgi:hypothetical protein
MLRNGGGKGGGGIDGNESRSSSVEDELATVSNLTWERQIVLACLVMKMDEMDEINMMISSDIAVVWSSFRVNCK